METKIIELHCFFPDHVYSYELDDDVKAIIKDDCGFKIFEAQHITTICCNNFYYIQEIERC